jgi:hypothetical protein
MLGQENEVFLAVDAGTVLLDKKNPRGGGDGGCFEPGLTR